MVLLGFGVWGVIEVNSALANGTFVNQMPPYVTGGSEVTVNNELTGVYVKISQLRIAFFIVLALGAILGAIALMFYMEWVRNSRLARDMYSKLTLAQQKLQRKVQTSEVSKKVRIQS